MKMKKTKLNNLFKAAITITVALSLIIPSVTVIAYIDYYGTMKVQSKTVYAGEQDVVIEVTGNWNATIAAYQVLVHFDPCLLDFVTVDFTDTVGESAAITIYDSDICYNCSGYIVASAIWMTSGPAPGEGVLVKLIFDVNPEAPNCTTVIDLIEEYEFSPNGFWRSRYTPPDGYGFTPELTDGYIQIINENSCPCEGGCGDSNHDGQVDVDDIVNIIGIIFPPQNGDPPVFDCCSDANGQGSVDIDDVVYLINYIFGGGPAPYGCCDGSCD